MQIDDNTVIFVKKVVKKTNIILMILILFIRDIQENTVLNVNDRLWLRE